MINRDQAEGVTNQNIGKAKEALGHGVGSEQLVIEGALRNIAAASRKPSATSRKLAKISTMLRRTQQSPSADLFSR